MRELGRILLVLSTVLGLSPLAPGQDGQSLGDLARQARQQNQQKDAADGQAPKAAKVITNDDIPRHSADSPPSRSSDQRRTSSNSHRASAGKLSAEQWKSRILAAKNAITLTQSEIDRINASIRFASPSCARNCVQRNELQIEKQQRVERLRIQLEDQKKRLQEMQESARQQGYGNTVYDP